MNTNYDIPDQPVVELQDFGKVPNTRPIAPGDCRSDLAACGYVKDEKGNLSITGCAQSFDFILHAGENNLQIDLQPCVWQFVLPPATATPTSIAYNATDECNHATTATTTSTTPTILPTTSTTTPSTTTTTTTKPPQTKLKELSFDDGTVDEWASLGGRTAQFGYLVRLTADTPFVVTKIRINSYIKGTPAAGAQFTVRITDKDQNQLWDLSLPMTLFSADPSWLEIQVPDIATNGAFCVEVYAPTLGQGLGPFIGVDESGTNKGSELLSNWQIVPWNIQIPKEKANFMIRAVGFAADP